MGACDRVQLGGIAGLLLTLREHEGAVEADLQRFYGVDYRDRWKVVDGRRVLTLRRIGVLLRHLPPESALAAVGRKGKPHWTIEAHLLDDLRLATTGSKDKPSKPNPSRPKPGPKRAKNLGPRLAAARRRRQRRAGG